MTLQAPELVKLRRKQKNDPGYNKAVDIWAIGVCLYILLSGLHPFQMDDEELMFDNIEASKWQWLGPNWDSISSEAKDLIVHMLDPDPVTRWNVDQCLGYQWLTGRAPDVELHTVKDELKSFQARKRLKGAILSVIATNRFQNIKASIAQRNREAGTSGIVPGGGGVVGQPIVATNVDFQILKIHLMSGRGILPKYDPYIRVWCGAFKYKTKTLTKTFQPVWNETIEIPASFAKVNPIDIECWNWDVVEGDDYLGEFSFKSDIISIGESKRRLFELEKPSLKSGRLEQLEMNVFLDLVIEKVH
eukprot:TRINITY_DN8277_c0_g3_i6.p1 TRINITY_DN8277_c0_g3~~TRINITY_DN8277_c0_g3_i6.p1  ORF type:complete len:303 (+),score=53.44 TRINITY_DN8277_c0_g3_i6:205-1113(+)